MANYVCIINTILDKNTTGYEEQGDWNAYEESEEISLHLPDTDNESNDSEILPRRRKHAFRKQFFIIKSCRKGLKKRYVLCESKNQP